MVFKKNKERLKHWDKLAKLKKSVNDYLAAYTANEDCFRYGFRIDCDTSQLVVFQKDRAAHVCSDIGEPTDAMTEDDQYSFVIDIKGGDICARNDLMLEVTFGSDGELRFRAVQSDLSTVMLAANICAAPALAPYLSNKDPVAEEEGKGAMKEAKFDDSSSKRPRPF